MKVCVIRHVLRIAEGENREENSQTSDLSQGQHPVHGGLSRGLATGGEADTGVGAAGGGGGGGSLLEEQQGR